MNALLLIGVFVIALLFQALFAGYETGFISFNIIRIRHLAEVDKDKRAQFLLKHKHKPEKILTTLLIGTNICVVISTMALTHQVGKEWISILIATPILLIFAEILPKSVFRMHPNRLSLSLVGTIKLFHRILAPLTLPTNTLTRCLLRILGSKEQHLKPLMSSLDDMRMIVDESAASGSIEREEQEMIHSVINLDTQVAKEIMVPRINIEAIPCTAKRAELIDRFEQTGHTRIPVFEETIDRVVGIVNAYDVLTDRNPDDETISRFIKDVVHVPDTVPLDELFSMLREQKLHMAIVTDEYGGTDGLVTVEDILEEIFGEILDEYDQEEKNITRISQSAYVVDAKTPLDELTEQLGISITDEEVETVGGWVMHTTGHIPREGHIIKRKRFCITILVAQQTHVSKIRLDILPQENETDES